MEQSEQGTGSVGGQGHGKEPDDVGLCKPWTGVWIERNELCIDYGK